MLSTSVWLALSPETRMKLAERLGLQRTGGSEVVDGRVVSDGFTAQSLALVTVSMLQEQLKSEETDFYKLFDLLVNEVENKKRVEEEPTSALPGEKVKFVGKIEKITKMEDELEETPSESLKVKVKKSKKANK